MKLFVGNLSYEMTEEEVRELFTPYEPILDFHRPRDRESGRPRGFAFVTLASRESGEQAIAELNDREVAGRQLKVNEAEDRRDFRPAPKYSPTEDISTRPKRVDDRPVGKDGKKVRYKGI